MEMEELKNIWVEDNQQLKTRIALNEKVIKRINLDKAITEFDKLMKTSLAGRNMALFYSAISFVFVFLLFDQVQFSLPLVVGALAMIWSFVHHLAIDTPKDYYSLPIIDLQKSICKFRLHSSSSMKSDILIVGLWYLTISPAFLFRIMDINIYSSYNKLALFIGVFVLCFLVLLALSKGIYDSYESKLRESELQLEEILSFEKA